MMVELKEKEKALIDKERMLYLKEKELRRREKTLNRKEEQLLIREKQMSQGGAFTVICITEIDRHVNTINTILDTMLPGLIE